MIRRETFDCSLCEITARSYGAFVQHMASIHLIEGPFQWKNAAGEWEWLRPVKETPKQDGEPS